MVSSQTVPKYLKKFIESGRIAVAGVDEQAEDMEFYGYTFRLYLESNWHWHSTLLGEAERLAAYAKRQGAEAHVGRLVQFSEKEHRKPYYKRDYVLVVISDPVAIWIEKQLKKMSGRGRSRV